MPAQIISLIEYRESLELIEAEVLELTEPLVNLFESEMAINERLWFMEIARSIAYPPLYCIQGGKK